MDQSAPPLKNPGVLARIVRFGGHTVQILLLILGALALTVMAIAAHSLAYFPGDVAISHAVQGSSSDWLDSVLGAVSWLGFPPQVDVLCGLIVIVMWLVQSRRAAVMEALAAIASGGIYLLLQLVVGQPRPTADLVRIAFPVQMSGFPSGHLSTLTAVLGFAAFVAYRRLSPAPVRWVPVVLVVAFLAVLSFARIYSGQHWPSDVLAGMLLGTLVLAVVSRLYVRLEMRQGREVTTGSERTLEHGPGADRAHVRSA